MNRKMNRKTAHSKMLTIFIAFTCRTFFKRGANRKWPPWGRPSFSVLLGRPPHQHPLKSRRGSSSGPSSTAAGSEAAAARSFSADAEAVACPEPPLLLLLRPSATDAPPWDDAADPAAVCWSRRRKVILSFLRNDGMKESGRVLLPSNPFTSTCSQTLLQVG